MSDTSHPPSDRVAAMREAFDRTFALPVAEQREETENIVTFQLKGDPYAVGVRQIIEVAAVDRFLPLPSPTPEFLGVTGLRGMIVPIYGLSMLLGYERDTDSPRWIVLVDERDPVGFAVGRIEGYRHVPKTSIYGPGADARKHVRSFAQVDGVMRAIVDVASALASVKGEGDVGRSGVA